MKKLLFYILPILIALPVTSGEFRSKTIDPRIDQNMLSDIINSLFSDDYDHTYQLCDSIIDCFPHDPSGYFFKAYSMMTEMNEDHHEKYQDEYMSLLDTVEILADDIIDTCNATNKAWCYWYIGNVWTYRSLWKARFGSFQTAFKLSKKAFEAYEDGIKSDSTLYDNYAGTGAFRYWKSAKSGLLRKFGIIKDEREKGIDELKLAARASLVSQRTAQKTLITVLDDYKQYDSAIVYANLLLTRYPNGRAFLWSISQAYMDKEDYESACQYLERLHHILIQRPGNYYRLIETDSKIVLCLDKSKNDDMAREWATKAKEYFSEVPDQVFRKLHKDIEYLNKMAEE